MPHKLTLNKADQQRVSSLAFPAQHVHYKQPIYTVKITTESLIDKI